MEIHDNYFERIDGGVDILISTTQIDGMAFSNNTYYAPGTPEFTVSSVGYDPSQWVSSFESDAKFTQKTFLDDSRTVETYMTSIGEPGTLDAFIERARAQSRYNWDTRYTAGEINDYIREGFGK